MSVRQDWDIVSGIGLTALFVAAGRAMETERSDRLIVDPYAAALMRAANAPVPLPGDDEQVDEIWHASVDYVAVRSRYFDDFFAQSCENGVGQAVILASGLDTRAYRVSWPENFRVFEIDQPKVLEFKENVLAEQEVTPSCTHRMVPMDLRDDWAAGLEAAGFDPSIPTAWLAEGLLPYLPADAERRLVDTVHRLSAPGSRIAVENVSSRSILTDMDMFQEVQQRFGLDMKDLFSAEERPDAAELFSARDWMVSNVDTADIVAGYGRQVGGIMATVATHGSMLIAELPS